MNKDTYRESGSRGQQQQAEIKTVKIRENIPFLLFNWSFKKKRTFERNALTLRCQKRPKYLQFSTLQLSLQLTALLASRLKSHFSSAHGDVAMSWRRKGVIDSLFTPLSPSLPLCLLTKKIFNSQNTNSRFLFNLISP